MSIDCDMTCGGDEAEICGGSNAMSVYRIHDVSVVGEKHDFCEEINSVRMV